MNQYQDAASPSFDSDDQDLVPLRCWECNVNFTSKHFLYSHLFHHIKQPSIVLNRVQLPSLKITLKSKRDNSFEIVHSPQEKNSMTNLPEVREVPEEEQEQEKQPFFGDDGEQQLPEGENVDENVEGNDHEEEEIDENSSMNFGVEEYMLSDQGSPLENEKDDGSMENSTVFATNSNSNGESAASDCGSIPGAEPTPPPEPSPDYPKIRIKTTGLLKEPLTITEITDDNPEGEPNNVSQNMSSSDHTGNMWHPSSLEDPLKLTENDDNILSLFNNNNERAKDLGFHTTESEFISLDRLEERNHGTMQLYNPSTSQSQDPLHNLTGLPMQALAQQVSRLQPNSAAGMHQQNVLINIQQFPSGPPPQPSYQPPPMYPHYPPQPMHQPPPYQYHPSYRPPNPMYYPPAPPNYPPSHMAPPPQAQMQQQMPPLSQQQPMGQPSMSSNHNMPPVSQTNQQMNPPRHPQQGNNYRQPIPGARQPISNARMPGPRAAIGQRPPLQRQRPPMVRPRSAGMTAVRSVRPRMATATNGMRPQTSSMKRTQESMHQMQMKKKKFDILTPDKDDEDCQVICMQPKNTDGGLPQIESVQGGTSEPVENSIMHLSDSITLSVRNPPPKPVEPKKSDAKAVANILATRGITVTATAKPKEKIEPNNAKTSPALPASINLNGAVSIIPAAKTIGGNAKGPSTDPLPTVDLTDDSNSNGPAQNPQQKRPGLPYRCDLCPAQYPNALGLSKHRQTYHKTSGGLCDLAIPVINLKTPGLAQKLLVMGINNYIPISSSGPDAAFALPIINARNPGNISGLGASQMITLGPIRSIPRPQGNAMKQANASK